MIIVETPTIQKFTLTHKEEPHRNFNFPPMPKMYLELLENKNKIKQQLVNKEYIPVAPSVPKFNQPLSTRLDELLGDDDLRSDGSDARSDSVLRLDDDHSISTNSSTDESDDNSRVVSSSNSPSDFKHPPRKPFPLTFPPTNREPIEHVFMEDFQQAPSYQRQIPQIPSSPKFAFRPPILPTLPENYEQKHVPSLDQLNLKSNVIPDLSYMKSNTEEDDLKRKLLVQFELLRDSYKDAKIPDFSMHSDYKTMKDSYDLTVRKLHITTSVSTYKTYLIGGFFLVEIGLAKYMGFDMKGFTQQQILGMSEYERLLLELGEKSYVDEESQWPVEVRLLGVIVMNAALFLGSKMIAKSSGGDILNMIRSMNTSNNVASATAKKRHMRGPNIDINNLPDIGPL
jgi:hypothetical protein